MVEALRCNHRNLARSLVVSLKATNIIDYSSPAATGVGDSTPSDSRWAIMLVAVGDGVQILFYLTGVDSHAGKLALRPETLTHAVS